MGRFGGGSAPSNIKVESEGAALAARPRPTVLLADGDEERVKLVEQRGIRGQMCLEEGPGLLVAGAGRQQTVADEHAADVRVGHEHGAAGRVEEDRIHGLRAEPGDGEQVPAKRAKGRATDTLPAPPVAAEQPPGEALQTTSLEPVGAGRPDHLGQPRLGLRGYVHGAQQPSAPQGPDCPRGIGPRRVLGQDGPDGDFVGRAARPPVLGAESPEQPYVEPEQAGLDRIVGRTGDRPPSQAKGGD